MRSRLFQNAELSEAIVTENGKNIGSVKLGRMISAIARPKRKNWADHELPLNSQPFFEKR